MADCNEIGHSWVYVHGSFFDANCRRCGINRREHLEQQLNNAYANDKSHIMKLAENE